MDTDSQKLFDRLVALEPEALNAEESAFIVARRDYLTTEQKKKFADLIEEATKPAKKAKGE